MTQTTEAARMPSTVRAVRFILTLQVAFSLVGLAILTGVAFATFDAPTFLLLAHGTATTGLAGWLRSRWPARMLFPVAIVVLVLLPAARRWFEN